jgi:predicted O-methyltransferase YrrM
MCEPVPCAGSLEGLTMSLDLRKLSGRIGRNRTGFNLARAIPFILLWFLGPVLIHRSIKRFKELAKSQKSVSDAIRFSNTFRYLTYSIAPVQNNNEIRRLLDMLIEVQPKRCLEIGTARGGTLYLISRTVHPEAKIISVDLPGGRWGHGYCHWQAPLYKSFARERQELTLIRGDSHEPATFRKVAEHLNSDCLDLLFIDGDHTYEGVKRDFQMYSELVADNGLIVLHDIVPNPDDKDVGVPRFWDEIKAGYEHEEMVDSWDQGHYGIGVIRRKS